MLIIGFIITPFLNVKLSVLNEFAHFFIHPMFDISTCGHMTSRRWIKVTVVFTECNIKMSAKSKGNFGKEIASFL